MDTPRDEVITEASTEQEKREDTPREPADEPETAKEAKLEATTATKEESKTEDAEEVAVEKKEQATTESPDVEKEADAPKEASAFDEPEVEEDQTQATTVANSDKSDDEEQLSKYMLLDRLFKFITIEENEGPVNFVLAGYFSKVVQLLINRKQKQIVPYIIADENKVVENLLRHVYSRSVAEVIHRLLHIVESNFEDDISAKIAEKKQLILSSLIEQLSGEGEDETVMNAAFILQDILEQKSFFQVLTKR